MQGSDLLGALVSVSPFADVHGQDLPSGSIGLVGQRDYDCILRLLVEGGNGISDHINARFELEADPDWGLNVENDIMSLTLMGIAASTRIPRLVQALAAFGGDPDACGVYSTGTDGDTTFLDLMDVWEM